MKQYLLLLLVLLLTSTTASAAVITGKVTDEKTGEPIVSASVQVVGTDIFAYTNSYGEYKINSTKSNSLKFSSIGHKSSVRTVSTNNRVDVSLQSQELSEISTTTLSVADIIKNAIAKRKDNQNRIETVKSSEYSKINVDVAGMLQRIPTPIKYDDQAMDHKYWRNIVAEEHRIKYSEESLEKKVVLQSRKTPNFLDGFNNPPLNNSVNFYNEIVELRQAQLTTPLRTGATDYYNYELIGKQDTDYGSAYVIEFNSEGNLFFGFNGVMHILEDTYELVYIKAKTNDDVLYHIDNIEFEQHFRKYESKFWYPSVMVVTGDLDMEYIIVKESIEAKATSLTVINSVEFNQAIPDSIYHFLTPKITTIEDTSSYTSDFWELNSPIYTSKEEMSIYYLSDSLGISKDYDSKVNLSLDPILLFNRVDGLRYGALMSIGGISQYFVPYVGVIYGKESKNYNYFFEVVSNITSKINTAIGYRKLSTAFSVNNNSDLFLSSLTAAFSEDYHDWFLSEEAFAAINYKFSTLQLNLLLSTSKSNSMENLRPNAIFGLKEWRDNPEIIDGRYSNATLTAKYNNINWEDSRNFGISSLVRLNLGYSTAQSQSFFHLFGNVKLSLPLFYTGYESSTLKVNTYAGTSSNAPLHQQYRMQTSILYFRIHDRFITPDYYKYGGAEQLEVHTKWDITDVWWRAIGIPTLNGRGLGLQLAYSAGYFVGDSNTPYSDTGGLVYQEAGFNITKIQIFGTPRTQLEVGFRWGLGSLAKDRFGFSISATSEYIDFFK